jgi:hypothetical protein
MGRPLKIAKAQAILTLTATNATGEYVTVTETLDQPTPDNPTYAGVIAGMPFVPASSVGGLVGGTTYWVLAVLSSHTFTVSATQLSNNPSSTPVNLSGTSAQSVKLSVGIVDSGFANPGGSITSTPANSTATYGVVGGNTTIYGSQTLTRVAFGISGNGTVYSTSANANIFGFGTDFTNTLSAGSAIQVINSVTSATTNLGFVTSAVAGYITIELSNATATGNFLTSVGNAQTLFASQPLVLDADIGGLTANTLYFVKTIVNAAAFSVSLQAGGGNIGLVNEDTTANATQDRVVLATGSTATATANSFVYANDEAGYINRQKGKTKYLVTGLTTSLTGACYTANLANAALTPNTMSILATYDDSSTAYVESLNDYQTKVFPTVVAPGSLVAGTVYSIYIAGTTNWTSVGAMANITGITFTATGTGSGTGSAVLASSSGETPAASNPAVISTFGTAYAANTYYTPSNPIVTIASA